MTTEQFTGYILIPALIVFIRVTDVSMGTLRIIFVSRGIRHIASVLGFFEVLIWLVAIGQIMHNLDSPLHYVAYAGGFSIGNYVGITIERKLSLGNRMVRIVTQKDASQLIGALSDKGYGVTSISAKGMRGDVKVIFSVVRRENVDDLIRIIKKFNPNAFFTVEEVRFLNKEYAFPSNSTRNVFRNFGNFIQKKK